MKPQEVEEMIAILNRRKSEETSIIEQKYEMDRKKLEMDRNHSLKRLEEKKAKATEDLVKAKDEMFKAMKFSEDWKEKVQHVKECGALMKGFSRQMSELSKYYALEFQTIRDNRDSSLRKLITEFSIERARIMDKAERPNKEASVNYWKKKYYQKAEELKKLKKTCAA